MTDATSSQPDVEDVDLTNDPSTEPALDDIVAADQGVEGSEPTVEDEAESQDVPEVAAFEPTPLFTSHNAIPLTPEASPDGAWLAYLLEAADGSIQFWLSPTDGGNRSALNSPSSRSWSATPIPVA